MSTTILFLMSCGVAFILSISGAYFVTGRLVDILHKRAILDVPNHRSSHSTPTPRGGGWGIISAWLLSGAILMIFIDMPQRLLWLLPALALLVWISWRDDRGHIVWWLRMGLQLLAVLMGLQALPAHPPIFQGWLPVWLEFLGMGMFWLWFINLTNFIDGIDGITGVNGFALGIGVALLGMMTIDRPWLTPFGLILAGAMLGFLVHNWHPARIFLGDVGSVPIGFISAFLILMLACSGHVVAAILLPLVPFLDATHTVLKRLLRGQKITEAHRDHAYQAAVIKGMPPQRIVLRIAMVNMALVCLALVSVLADSIVTQLSSLTAGLVITGLLLYIFHKN